ncbi:MAG: sigma-54-dependent Fis family transcriptional regulator [Ignavibacteria bacterium]|nr:sigma-54-dependent Fis family transcriptional regulator [Ignavibacteria bacterium]
MSVQAYKIAVLEMDPALTSLISEALEDKYAGVSCFESVEDAMDSFRQSEPDLLLLDIFLGPVNGLEIVDAIRSAGMAFPIILITGFSDIKLAVRAMRIGADDFIIKPFDKDQLEVTVDRALINSALRKKVKELEANLFMDDSTEILGTSPAIRKAVQIAQIVAKAEDTTALILGESGTGKELMARFIHSGSGRSRQPFITINCGAIPRELAENEFFGYEKGAFTGATEKVKPGRFEQADKGTILLDEVGELSLEMQVKLLRVLQERTFYRLGGTKEVEVDVRIVAATNRDLEQLVEEGKFREDLFYRLNVATIHLPPLRERQEDILPLASVFVTEFNKKFGKTVSGFSPEAAEILQHHPWKGNIRELRNVIERIILLESEDTISKESLSFLRVSSQSQKHKDLAEGQHFLQIHQDGVLMNNVVKDLILQTLSKTNGNQIRAAKILGVSRAKLRYRIDQLGINAKNQE